jgi:ABC-type Fe3+-siderophore transport system permease subunit
MSVSLAHIIDSILTIYVWIAAAAIIFFLFLIARFFQRKSDQRSYFQYYVIPATLFVVVGIWLVFGQSSYVEDPIANILLVLAGAAVGVLGGYLRMLMVGRRR